jgi:hypothetical protein
LPLVVITNLGFGHFGLPGLVTPEWLDGGTDPHDRTPSGTGVHGDRSRRLLLDRAIPRSSMPRSCRSICHCTDSWRGCSRRSRCLTGYPSARGTRRRYLILLGAVCAGEFPREESCYRSTKSVDREVHRGHMSSWVGIAVHAHQVWSRTLRRTLPSRLCRRPSWPGGWASHLDVRAAP